jgi:hypothetical protein
MNTSRNISAVNHCLWKLMIGMETPHGLSMQVLLAALQKRGTPTLHNRVQINCSLSKLEQTLTIVQSNHVKREDATVSLVMVLVFSFGLVQAFKFEIFIIVV